MKSMQWLLVNQTGPEITIIKDSNQTSLMPCAQLVFEKVKSMSYNTKCNWGHLLPDNQESSLLNLSATLNLEGVQKEIWLLCVNKGRLWGQQINEVCPFPPPFIFRWEEKGGIWVSEEFAAEGRKKRRGQIKTGERKEKKHWWLPDVLLLANLIYSSWEAFWLWDFLNSNVQVWDLEVTGCSCQM